MTAARWKIVLAAVLLIGAAAYLGFAGVQKGWVYYVDIDAYLADSQYRDQRIRLAGRVADQDVQIEPALLVARFDVVGKTGKMPVEYRGVIPEMFKPGCEVVVEGKSGQDGIFHADVMMTKCASKYENEDHAKRLEAQP